MARVEKMWAIQINRGRRQSYYCGTWPRRKDAVDAHCKALGKDWAYCKRMGDRAVKVAIMSWDEYENLKGWKRWPWRKNDFLSLIE